MLHWRPVLTFGVLLVLLTIAAVGGGFHWSSFSVSAF
jgi:hypothetical protein